MSNSSAAPVTTKTEYGIAEILNAVDDVVAIDAAVVRLVPLLTGWSWLQLPTLISTVTKVIPAVQNIASLNLPEFLKEVQNLDANEAQVIANEVASDLGKDGLPYGDVVAELVKQVTATYNMVQTWIADIKAWFHL